MSNSRRVYHIDTAGPRAVPSHLHFLTSFSQEWKLLRRIMSNVASDAWATFNNGGEKIICKNRKQVQRYRKRLNNHWFKYELTKPKLGGKKSSKCRFVATMGHVHPIEDWIDV